MHDLRGGVRSLRARPGFTIIAILTLALGIGANTAVFSVVNGVLLRPIQFNDSDRLVVFWNRSPGLNIAQDWLSPGEYFRIKSQTDLFQDTAIAFVNTFNLTGSDQSADPKPERVGGATVASSLFSVLQVNPNLGRAFLPEDDRTGAHTAIISDALWHRRFGADPAVVGRSIIVDGRDYTVTGVMPAGCRLNNETIPAYHPVDAIDVLMPLQLPESADNDLDHEDYTVLARLRPGITSVRAQAEVDTIVASLRQDHPDHYPPNSGFTVSVVPMLDHVAGDSKRTLLTLLASVVLVLVIACANVASLLLSVGASRRREIAIRSACGASRIRIVRQLLAETSLLALPGGLLGLLLAFWTISLLRSVNPGNIPRIGEINIDVTVMGFTFAATLLTGLLFGLVPALTASKVDVNETLKESGRGLRSGASAIKLRRVVVGAQVALCVLVLAAAGLLIRSFGHLRSIDPGFATTNVLSLRLSLAGSKYSDPLNREAFYDQMWERLRNLPGVISAGGVSQLPLSADLAWTPVWVEGYTPRPGEAVIQSDLHIASAGYFQTMGIPLIKGRYFDAHDTRASQRVAIIDEGFAEQLIPGQDPIGKRLKLGTKASESPWLTIVGVVKSVRQYGLDAGPRITCYFAHAQYPTSGMYVVVRSSSPAAGFVRAVSGEVAALDSGLPVYDISTMEQRLQHSLAKRRFSMMMLLGFGVIAVVLAVVGIYGVASYSVAERTHEIGIKMALGAGGGDVVRQVLSEGGGIILAGVAVGLLAALIATRLMAGLLYGVSASDPITFIVVPLILIGAGLIAEVVPARRAAAVDPIVALRYE